MALSALTLDKLTKEVITLKEGNNTEEYLGQIVLGLRYCPLSALCITSSVSLSRVKADKATLPMLMKSSRKDITIINYVSIFRSMIMTGPFEMILWARAVWPCRP